MWHTTPNPPLAIKLYLSIDVRPIHDHQRDSDHMLINCELSSEPFAAVSEPPAGHANGQSGGDRPPEGQRQVGEKPRDREGHPEDFALHGIILACRTEWVRKERQAVSSILARSKLGHISGRPPEGRQLFRQVSFRLGLRCIAIGKLCRCRSAGLRRCAVSLW